MGHIQPGFLNRKIGLSKPWPLADLRSSLTNLNPRTSDIYWGISSGIIWRSSRERCSCADTPCTLHQHSQSASEVEKGLVSSFCIALHELATDRIYLLSFLQAPDRMPYTGRPHQNQRYSEGALGNELLPQDKPSWQGQALLD